MKAVRAHWTGPMKAVRAHSAGLMNVMRAHSAGSMKVVKGHSAGSMKVVKAHSAGSMKVVKAHSAGSMKVVKAHSAESMKVVRAQWHNTGPTNAKRKTDARKPRVVPKAAMVRWWWELTYTRRHRSKTHVALGDFGSSLCERVLLPASEHKRCCCDLLSRTSRSLRRVICTA